MQNFLPRSYFDHKKMEFMYLKQRTITVAEYERKFNQLSRYAPHLVDANAKKARLFERSLHAEISSILAG